MPRRLTVMLAMGLLFGVGSAESRPHAVAHRAPVTAFDPAVRYRLTTVWQGRCRSLDIVNDGRSNNQVAMAPTGNFSGQLWKIMRTRHGDYRLSTEWQGEARSLAWLDTGSGARMMLADRRDDPAQRWTITPGIDGAWRLSTRRQGARSSLDVFNDGAANNRPVLATTANVSGQRWKITEARAGDGDDCR